MKINFKNISILLYGISFIVPVFTGSNIVGVYFFLVGWLGVFSMSITPWLANITFWICINIPDKKIRLRFALSIITLFLSLFALGINKISLSESGTYEKVYPGVGLVLWISAFIFLFIYNLKALKVKNNLVKNPDSPFSIPDIKREVEKFARIIDAPEKYFPGFGSMTFEAHPYITNDASGTMFYITSERGVELDRMKTGDINELLFWIFSDITFRMACDYEIKHRNEAEDFRRVVFTKQVELLGALDQSWAQKEDDNHKEILKSHPFDDIAMARAMFTKKLRDTGHSAAEAWTEACKKYPLPGKNSTL